jgi:hypothetical protein
MMVSIKSREFIAPAAARPAADSSAATPRVRMAALHVPAQADRRLTPLLFKAVRMAALNTHKLRTQVQAVVDFTVMVVDMKAAVDGTNP